MIKNCLVKNLKLSVLEKPVSRVNNERNAIIEILEQKREVLPYSKDKLIIEHLKKLGLEHKAFTYEECGELVTGFKCPKCNTVKYVSSSSCNLRICEKCCKKLFYKLWSKYLPNVRRMRNPKLITVTFGFTPILRPEVITEFRRMFSIFRKKLKQIKGGVYVFEVKRSPHKIECIEVHIHALVDSPYIPQKRLSDVWFKSSGRFRVDIRKAYSRKKGLGYIMKYVLKKPNFPLARDYAMYEFMFNSRRRIQGFGNCYKTSPSLVKMEITCPNCSSKMEVFEDTSCWLLKIKLESMSFKGVG
jgi:hypothetical protein